MSKATVGSFILAFAVGIAISVVTAGPASAAPGSNPGITTANGCHPSRACSVAAFTATTGVFTGTVSPAADNTYNLGALAKTWSDAFITAIKDTDGDVRVNLTQNASTIVFGNVADGASAIAVKFANSNTHTTAGAKIAAFYTGNGAITEKANVDLNGSFHLVGNATLQTCAAAIEGKISRDVLSGVSTGKRTKLCLCTSDGAGTPAYVWQNLATGTLGASATVCGTE